MCDEAAVVADGSISTKTAVTTTVVRNVKAVDEVADDEASTAADDRCDRGRETEPDPPRGPAAVIAAGVRDGSLLPTRVVAEAAARIAVDRKANAVNVAHTERAMAEAAALEQRVDLDVLPLAGVPVAIEHRIPIEGEAGTAEHPVVRRLRAAGAVVVSAPELGLWGTIDSPRNPWNSARCAGGASGAAVAAGLVPVAYGSDGLGSVRVAAACCGVFGIKPGRCTVPVVIGADAWSGMVENGVLATTVGDAALALSVMAARPDLAEVDPPGRLRIGLALNPSARLFRIDRHWTAAARRAGSVAEAAGHVVEPTALPYDNALFSVFLRWLSATAVPDDGRLSWRTRRHLALGRFVQRLVRPAQIDRVEARLLEFFDHYDVVITPALTAPPPKVRARHTCRQPSCARFSPFIPLWNLVGWPAASVPMGMQRRAGTPVAAQLSGPPGSESTLLRLSAQLEISKPWKRIAP
ncbi:amidase family protein [Nocardia sp. NBC_01730]|uniref:amidase n=1 Tax=Nocardia sp. NBC_01730 TaxID=2975998 RepID=UPI002E0D3762|nr:amidase family protein [Nocardia sp. NBC_01730]